MIVLLDTSTLVRYLRGVQPVVERMQASPRNGLAMPAIVAYELEYGTLLSSAQRRTKVEVLFRHIPSVPFDLQAARAAADIRADLERDGQTIGPMDLLIAGTAVSRKAALVTANAREFSRVKGLRLLDWMR